MGLRNIHTTTAECNQETPIPVSARRHIRSEKVKKWISINTNHSYQQHLFKPVSTNLKINPDLVLSNPMEKDCVQRWTI